MTDKAGGIDAAFSLPIVLRLEVVSVPPSMAHINVLVPGWSFSIKSTKSWHCCRNSAVTGCGFDTAAMALTHKPRRKSAGFHPNYRFIRRVKRVAFHAHAVGFFPRRKLQHDKAARSFHKRFVSRQPNVMVQRIDFAMHGPDHAYAILDKTPARQP